MPKVSVIIPTFNRAELLSSAIESVLRQTFSDLEVVVSDDKSTDRTREMVESFKDERVRYVLNQGNKGPSATRNNGILSSDSEYIAFLDDDDEWLPHKLEKQILLLDNSPSSVCGVYTNRLMINKKTGVVFSDKADADTLRGSMLSQLMIKNPIHTSTFVIRRSCIQQIGLFDESMSYMEDRDMWIRLSMQWEIEYIDEPLIKAYFHGQSHLSYNLEGQIRGREILLRRYRNLLKNNKKSWSNQYLCLGAQYCQLQQMKKGRENILKGILIYPFCKLSYFHLLSSLLGPRNYQRIRKIDKTSI